jgi:serine/threonine protein kinase
MGLSDGAVGRLRGVGRLPEFATDRYDIVEEIGRGGMGAVYLARDRELDRDVAIKVPHDAGSAALERRLRVEARALARLEHPGIVPIHDVGRLADGRLFYVMKRVRGRTLRAHLSDVAERAERLRIFERICEPVAFAHAHGCIHRDLKPENIMIGSFGEVLVLDWGVARVVDAEADEPSQDRAVVVGTRGFMSPEQAAATAEADHRTDVYSLGAILALLLTGSDPVNGEPSIAILRDRKVPRPLRSICARALAAARGDRYPSVSALAADVARYRLGAAVEAHRESLAERTMRVARTYRVAILLVVAYVVMRAFVAFTFGR